MSYKRHLQLDKRESKPYDKLHQEILMKITCSKDRLKTKAEN